MYYLYRHIRLDTNNVFYIGIGTITSNKLLVKTGNTFKGRYRRAYSKKSRNPYWHNIINKTSYRVEIILESNDINYIINKEKEFINIYQSTLCNLTVGGFGIESYKHDETTKKKISSSMKGRKLSASHIFNINKRKFKKIIGKKDNNLIRFDSLKSACIFLNIPSSQNISSCLKNKRKTAYGYEWYYEITEIENKESL